MEVGIGSSGARWCPRAFRHDDCKSALSGGVAEESWWEVLVVVRLARLGGETSVSVRVAIISRTGSGEARMRLAGDH